MRLVLHATNSQFGTMVLEITSRWRGVGCATRCEQTGVPPSVYGVLWRTECSNNGVHRVELEKRTEETQVVGIDIGIEFEFDPAQRRPFHSPLTAFR
jgi:hypothetical protein